MLVNLVPDFIFVLVDDHASSDKKPKIHEHLILHNLANFGGMLMLTTNL